jgi:hypothetical protein
MVRSPWVKMLATGVASLFGTAGAHSAMATEKTTTKSKTTTLDSKGTAVKYGPNPTVKYGPNPVVKYGPNPCMTKKCKPDQTCNVVNGKAKCSPTVKPKYGVIVEVGPTVKYGPKPTVKYGPNPNPQPPLKYGPKPTTD